MLTTKNNNNNNNEKYKRNRKRKVGYDSQRNIILYNNYMYYNKYTECL